MSQSILFIDNSGGGFATTLSVTNNSTISDVIRDKGIDPSKFKIRVDRKVVESDHIMRAGERVTVTPLKVDGGC